MTTYATTRTFGAFKAELIPNDDREGVNCFISRGRYSASLSLVMDFGCLDPDDAASPMIDETVLDRIIRWAEANGY